MHGALLLYIAEGCINIPFLLEWRSFTLGIRRTDIVQNEKHWEVTLDHRRLKTPNGSVFTVNTEPLARAVAAEWDAQHEYITRPTMHLEEELRKLQEKKWEPVLEWFCKRFGVTQEVSKGLELPPIKTETRAVLARHFLSYDFPSLTALNFGVEALKSPILMLACVERHLEPKDAVMLARLEEEYQVSRWGRVPWAHELNQAELTARVSASLLVIHANSERHSATQKNKEDKR
ncbi:unnamed protein product [Danaus chrysippus]|uniref:(African queen) hypothetical protein n=1 Tax=Danaus chrysippus TaxID=151541 RepID=A0A8J2QWI1_9NEOP|nr:unnamed protein product [Danaus chrysippus]